MGVSWTHWKQNENLQSFASQSHYLYYIIFDNVLFQQERLFALFQQVLQPSYRMHSWTTSMKSETDKSLLFPDSESLRILKVTNVHKFQKQLPRFHFNLWTNTFCLIAFVLQTFRLRPKWRYLNLNIRPFMFPTKVLNHPFFCMPGNIFLQYSLMKAKKPNKQKNLSCGFTSEFLFHCRDFLFIYSVHNREERKIREKMNESLGRRLVATLRLECFWLNVAEGERMSVCDLCSFFPL